VKKGFLIIISSPSGCGKTTIREELLKLDKNLLYSISCTTRPPRKGEKNGKDYFFLSEEEFHKKIKNNEFLEWAEVHGYLYGTPKEFIEKNLKEGKIIVMDIDVQGAEKIKKKKIPAVFVFLLPPSWEELKKRLTKRGTEDKKEMEMRLIRAKEEMKYYPLYDYLVVNRTIPETVEEVYAIIKAEKRKRERMEEWLKENLSV